MSQFKLWSKDDISLLINAVENDVLKTFPVTSINNNHEFTGNLLDIINDWNRIANQLNRSGELLNDRVTSFVNTILIAKTNFFRFSFGLYETMA